MTETEKEVIPSGEYDNADSIIDPMQKSPASSKGKR